MSPYVPPNKLLNLKFPQLVGWNPDQAGPLPPSATGSSLNAAASSSSIPGSWPSMDIQNPTASVSSEYPSYPNVGTSDPTVQAIQAYRANGYSANGLTLEQFHKLPSHYRKAAARPGHKLLLGPDGNIIVAASGMAGSSALGLGYNGALAGASDLGPGSGDGIMDVLGQMDSEFDNPYEYEYNRAKGPEEYVWLLPEFQAR